MCGCGPLCHARKATSLVCTNRGNVFPQQHTTSSLLGLLSPTQTSTIAEHSRVGVGQRKGGEGLTVSSGFKPRRVEVKPHAHTTRIVLMECLGKRDEAGGAVPAAGVAKGSACAMHAKRARFNCPLCQLERQRDRLNWPSGQIDSSVLQFQNDSDKQQTTHFNEQKYSSKHN